MRCAEIRSQDKEPRGASGQTLIGRYRSEPGRLRQVSGSRRESVLHEAVEDLLGAWGCQRDLVVVCGRPQDNIVFDDARRVVDALRP